MEKEIEMTEEKLAELAKAMLSVSDDEDYGDEDQNEIMNEIDQYHEAVVKADVKCTVKAGDKPTNDALPF